MTADCKIDNRSKNVSISASQLALASADSLSTFHPTFTVSMFKFLGRHLKFLKRSSRRSEHCHVVVESDSVSFLPKEIPVVETQNVRDVQPDNNIPLIRFSKSDAINEVLKHLPCKAAQVPTAKILGAFREFEDAYNTQSQQRKTAALNKLLQCLPFQSDKLDHELHRALRSLQSAFTTASVTRRDPDSLLPRKNDFSDVPPPNRSQPNSRPTTKSVFAIVNKSVDPNEVIKNVRAVHDDSILSTHIHPNKHDQRTKIIINFKTSEIANRVVEKGWTTHPGANKMYFKLQLNKGFIYNHKPC